MRQRRQEINVELRKNKRDDQLLKRRNIEVCEPTSPLQESNAQSPDLSGMPMEEIVPSIQNDNLSVQFKAVQTVHKMSSKEKNPPIDTIINMGLVPILIKFLDDFEK
jgi:Importin beta binding domain